MFYKYLFFFFLFLINNSYECDIWKAADCPQGPSKDDENLMKSQLYTEEQLLAYCDSGKAFADCVNEHLLCCDMRTEYAAALASLDIQLKRNALRVGKYCTDFNETNPIQYKCRTTLRTIPGTRYRSTTAATPVCNLEKAGKQCSPIIENRVRFDRRWSAQEKVKWCKDVYEYHTCALSYITNCTITPVAGDVAQLTVFLDYIEKSANRECPGGLFGCTEKSNDDSRCQDKISFFLEKNALANETTMIQISRLTLHFVTTVFVDKHLQIPCYLQITKRNENEYSRYRNSNLSRDRSINRTDTRLKTHYKCRSLIYDSEAKVSKNKLFNNKQLILFAFLLKRFNVSDDKVSWNVDYPDYKPVEYTTTKIQRNPKADSCDPSKITKFNQVDNKIDRRSFTGFYYIDPITQRPRNPIGRTGMTGRGRLYHWGPNHAGDPVVTRWKRDENGSIVYRRINAHHHLKPVLEFVAIRRRDTKEWALPGGMVDPGENVSNTVMREFQEEALRDGLDENLIKRLFSKGYKLYESYVDDPRNTDNAWMETVAMHFHDETGQLTDHLDLHAGDDADKVVWCTVDQTLQLYASHKDFLKAAVDRFDAFW
ncbi:unnamed protein product [Rotaria sp. Silwood2]|nr:unnamed protein product [Rotaria sp. Silwood2]